MDCTEEKVSEKEFQIAVAVEEATKWADWTYQVMQYLRTRSGGEVSF